MPRISCTAAACERRRGPDLLRDPAFFIESSDVLMLGRRERILQSFAGPYFEMVATGAAALVLWAWPHGSLATRCIGSWFSTTSCCC